MECFVSEPFHVANFGRAPRPFFFLAPSREDEELQIQRCVQPTGRVSLQYRWAAVRQKVQLQRSSPY
jgi:hypothetical protein